MEAEFREVQVSGPKTIQGKSRIVKRSIVINGHKTSISVEDEFWAGLKEIAAEKEVTLGSLVGKVDSNRSAANLSSALRLFILNFYMEKAGCRGTDESWRPA